MPEVRTYEGEVKKYLTLEEISEALHMPYDTVRKKVKAGELKGYKPGKRVLVEEKELELFVKRSEMVTS